MRDLPNVLSGVDFILVYGLSACVLMIAILLFIGRWK